MTKKNNAPRSGMTTKNNGPGSDEKICCRDFPFSLLSFHLNCFILMTLLSNDKKLFEQLYDAHPQAIIWMQPIWDESKKIITDFHYLYANEEALKYMNIAAEDMPGLTIFNSPTLNDELRKKIFAEMLGVYSTGEKSETSVYNPVLKKYARVLRSKLRGGILTVI